MADDKSNDILMKFVQIGGALVDGEAQSEISAEHDKLLTGFQPGKFLQIADFAFGVAVEDEDSGRDILGAAQASGAGLRAGGPKIPFGRWKSARPGEAGAIKYPVRMDPFSFTRTLGKASMAFFDHCINSISFESATLVKRKIIGHHGNARNEREVSQLSGLRAFLRIDFTDVLLIGLDWDDGDTITEKARFVFRKMVIQYRRQNPDGTLQGISSVPWEHEVETVAKAGGK